MMESTTNFTITYPYDVVCSKIAPGMAYQFTVNFNVRDVKEYSHSINVETEGELLQVLIICK